MTICLWFDQKAETAGRFYTSIFKNSKITGVSAHTEATAKNSHQEPGDPFTVMFELDGQKFMGLNGGPYFEFAPMVSFFVDCETESEIDSLWSKLSAGGQARMALAKTPFAEKYGWLEDQFGVSWQLMLGEKKKSKITPAILFVGKNKGRALAAMEKYTSVFPDSAIEQFNRTPDGNVILHARYHLGSQPMIAFESPVDHDFELNESISFVVKCKNQNEIDHYTHLLSAGNPHDQCGWVKDQFGISWQIVPEILETWMMSGDLKMITKIMDEVMTMKTLDLEALTQVANANRSMS